MSYNIEDHFESVTYDGQNSDDTFKWFINKNTDENKIIERHREFVLEILREKFPEDFI